MECFPTKDPALTGRCYRRLIAPLSGPIKDQDLRVGASTVSTRSAGSPRSAPRSRRQRRRVRNPAGVLGMFSRQGASCTARRGRGRDLSGRLIPSAISSMPPTKSPRAKSCWASLKSSRARRWWFMPWPLWPWLWPWWPWWCRGGHGGGGDDWPRLLQETSDERCCQKRNTEHSYSPLPLGVPAPASCRRPGACRRAIKPEANPSFCDLPHFLPVRHNFAASLAVARTRKALKCSVSQRNGMPSQVRLRLTM